MIKKGIGITKKIKNKRRKERKGGKIKRKPKRYEGVEKEGRESMIGSHTYFLLE